MKTIEIVVHPNGQTQIETKGFAGSECRQASEFLEKALGQKTKEVLTSEFYTQQTETEKLQEGE